MGAWLLALALARAGDTASTCAALARGGAYEANPLLPSSCPAVIGVEVGVTVMQGWAMHTLAAHGHRTAAKVVGAVSITFEVGLTVRNLRVGR